MFIYIIYVAVSWLLRFVIVAYKNFSHKVQYIIHAIFWVNVLFTNFKFYKNKAILKGTPPKTKMDTQTNGLEKVTPFKYGHFEYLFVQFLGSNSNLIQPMG